MNKLIQLYRDNVATKRPENIVNVAEQSIYIYDVISGDWGVSAISVINALNSLDQSKPVSIHINSPGGDVFEGRAIMAAIRAYGGGTVAVIDSLCASAATSIALACDSVEMADGAFFMIHNASGFAWGDKSAMRDTANLLEKVEGAIIADYVSKTGIDDAEIMSMMDAETWFTANEAKEKGFVDVVTNGKKASNTWNLSAYKRPPPENKEPNEPAPAEFFMSEANTNRLRLLQLA